MNEPDRPPLRALLVALGWFVLAIAVTRLALHHQSGRSVSMSVIVLHKTRF